MKFLAALATLGLSLWASVGFAAEPVTIPGSRLALIPPEGFSLAKEFAGLQGDKASVLVVELPANTYDELVAAISSGAAKTSRGCRSGRGSIAGDKPPRAWRSTSGSCSPTAARRSR